MLDAKQSAALLVVVCCSACPTSEKKPDGVVPKAASITIYSTGGSVVSGSIDSSTLGGQRLRLPSTAKGVNLSQNGESVKWFTIESVKEQPKTEPPTPGKTEKKETDEKYRLVGVPPLKPGELKF